MTAKEGFFGSCDGPGCSLVLLVTARRTCVRGSNTEARLRKRKSICGFETSFDFGLSRCQWLIKRFLRTAYSDWTPGYVFFSRSSSE